MQVSLDRSGGLSLGIKILDMEDVTGVFIQQVIAGVLLFDLAVRIASIAFGSSPTLSTSPQLSLRARNYR